ncbi:hypothetical protein AcV5_009139 [Taiwanofungus camphoratus]|nr:hypothetical protein AcV5_009139 [Antrodia cinnamomea]
MNQRLYPRLCQGWLALSLASFSILWLFQSPDVLAPERLVSLVCMRPAVHGSLFFLLVDSTETLYGGIFVFRMSTCPYTCGPP